MELLFFNLLQCLVKMQLEMGDDGICNFDDDIVKFMENLLKNLSQRSL